MWPTHHSSDAPHIGTDASEDADNDQVERNDVVEEARHDEDQDAGDQRGEGPTFRTIFTAWLQKR